MKETQSWFHASSLSALTFLISPLSVLTVLSGSNVMSEDGCSSPGYLILTETLGTTGCTFLLAIFFFFFFNQKENHAHSSTKWDYMSIPSLKAAWKRVNYFQPLWYKVSSAGKVKRRKRWLQGGQPASSVYHKHPVYTVQWRLDQVRSHAASFSLVSWIK